MKENLAETTSGMATLGGVAKLLIANRLGVPFQLASTLNRLARLDLGLDQEGVRTSGLHKLLNATFFHIKRDLKHKARIKVPDSYTLVGVCDEDDYLRPRQIYGMSFFVTHLGQIYFLSASLRSTFRPKERKSRGTIPGRAVFSH
jgi:hypothetical protein